MKETVNALCSFLDNIRNTISPHSTGAWSVIMKLIAGTVLGFVSVGVIAGCYYLLSPLYDYIVDALSWKKDAASMVCVILSVVIIIGVMYVWVCLEIFIEDRAADFRKQIIDEYVEETKRQRRFRREANKRRRVMEEYDSIRKGFGVTVR